MKNFAAILALIFFIIGCESNKSRIEKNIGWIKNNAEGECKSKIRQHALMTTGFENSEVKLNELDGSFRVTLTTITQGIDISTGETPIHKWNSWCNGKYVVSPEKYDENVTSYYVIGISNGVQYP